MPRKPIDPHVEQALLDAYPFARSLALMLARNAFEAEDLVQEAMLCALRTPLESSNPGVIHAWLRTTIVRSHVRARSRLKRDALAFARIFIEPPPVPATTKPSDEMLQALRTLAPRQRACVVLRYVHDLPEDEIAPMLGISEGTVKAHLAQAREKLRKSGLRD
ncbi:MAG: RNA polymerase sigma factor [Actinomycetota bacterium]